MALKNLVGFVKMAIIGNPNVDNATATTLCQYVEDLKVLIDNQNSLIKALRADLDGTSREVERLRELNNNQAWLIANNRTKRSDFHV